MALRKMLLGRIFWVVLGVNGLPPFFTVAWSQDKGSVGSELNVAPSSTTDLEEASEEFGALERFSANYFGILYGPSVQNPRSYQPTPSGQPDSQRPVIVKNFLNLGYSLSREVAITGTGYWIWQPVMGQQLTLEDPFLRISHNSILNTERMNLYGDLRVHFPVASSSRENDLHFGIQSVQVFSYRVSNTRFTLGVYGSERWNSFGGQGYGNDLELYVAPNFNYQLGRTVALTFLVELQGSHPYGNKPFAFKEDGIDLEPGLSWDITPTLMVNPYLHVPIAGSTAFGGTSVGMMLNWAML